ncbi:MAG: DUF6458 family protein, partial [Streptosporangiaceae bacterium]
MKIGTGLTLIVVGAIFAFAVTTNTSVFNLHVMGYVLILAGIAAIAIPRRQYAQVSKRLVTTRRSRTWASGAAIQTQETEVPPYVTINPGSDLSRGDPPAIPSIPADPTVARVMTPGQPLD